MSFTRPIIPLDNHELADESEASADALTAWADQSPETPPVMSCGSSLVRVRNGNIEELGGDGLRKMLARSARYITTNTQGNPQPKYPPTDIVKVLLDEDAGSLVLRKVRTVATIPILDKTGELLDRPGLHDSGIWYAPELDNVHQHIRDVQDVDSVQAARDLLANELLGDFDFKDQASRANAIALTLLPFVREFIGDAPTPLHAVIAPQQGSGKTTLARACLAPGLGLIDVAAKSDDEEEMRKKITSVLRSGKRSIIFDNLNSELAGGSIAAALTSTRWSDRILGESTDVVLDNYLIWVATGNNIGTSSELRDRVCPVWLQPHGGVPARYRSTGEFVHPEIVEWALQNRAQLAGACVTLVLHWLHGKARALRDGSFHRDDERRSGKQTMGSFNTWARIMGGILEEADVHGFLENRDQLDTVDLEGDEIAVFFEQLILKFSDETEFTTQDLTHLCQFGGPLHEHLPGDVGSLRDNAGHRLGRWMAKHRDSVHGGIRLRSRVGAGRAQVWRLERL